MKTYLNEFSGKVVRGATFPDYYECDNYMNTGHKRYELEHNFQTDEDMKKTVISFNQDQKHPDVYVPEGETVHLRIYSWDNTPIHIKSDGTLVIHTQIAERNKYGINGNLGIERIDEDYNNDALVVVVEFLGVPAPKKAWQFKMDLMFRHFRKMTIMSSDMFVASVEELKSVCTLLNTDNIPTINWQIYEEEEI